MACVRFSQNSGTVATSTSAKTIAEITAPANTGLWIDEVNVDFYGTSSTQAKVLVQLVRGSTGSVGTTTNPVKADATDDETLQCTGKTNLTDEGSVGTVIDQAVAHPQGSVKFTRRYRIKGGDTFRIRCTTGTDVNCATHIGGEE